MHFVQLNAYKIVLPKLSATYKAMKAFKSSISTAAVAAVLVAAAHAHRRRLHHGRVFHAYDARRLLGPTKPWTANLRLAAGEAEGVGAGGRRYYVVMRRTTATTAATTATMTKLRLSVGEDMGVAEDVGVVVTVAVGAGSRLQLTGRKRVTAATTRNLCPSVDVGEGVVVFTTSTAISTTWPTDNAPTLLNAPSSPRETKTSTHSTTMPWCRFQEESFSTLPQTDS